MNSAEKNNLRKLNFLGFVPPQSDGNIQNEPLDEECAKVFAMDTDSTTDSFDILKFHESLSPTSSRQFSENDYSQHRNYPHSHPGKMKRRLSSNNPANRTTPISTPTHSNNTNSLTTASLEEDTNNNNCENDTTTAIDLTTLLSDVSGEKSEGTGAVGATFEGPEMDEEEEEESECVLSDPCAYGNSRDAAPSPERKMVQFVDCGTNQHSTTNDEDPFDVDGLKNKKQRRHNQSLHPKFRKFSLPEESQKKRHHHHHHHHHQRKSLADVVGNGNMGGGGGGDVGSGSGSGNNKHARRVSTQPEDLPLLDADRDQLDSHRSDDSRGMRRHKTSQRLSNVSMVHIGRKEGQELHASFKKMYDHSPHAIFVELAELCTTNDEREWKETARWIKYEEDVEEGVDRWGKPHVASLSFHSLLNLRKCLEDGLVVLDMEERDLPAIAYRVTEDLYKEDLIKEEDKAKLMRALLCRHRHVNEHHDRGFRFSKKQSYTSLQNLTDAEKRKISFPVEAKNGVNNNEAATNRLLSPENSTIIDIKEETYSASAEDVHKARNDAILRRIPVGAQSSSIMVGEVDFLEQPAIAFIRLAEGVVIPSLVEVSIPVRFIFILLGPKLFNLDYHEVGRSISTLMANQQFHNIAYGATNKKALLSAINEFLDDSIVLPPGDWEHQALLPIEELKAKSEAIRRRKERAIKEAQNRNGGSAKKSLLTTLDSNGNGTAGPGAGGGGGGSGGSGGGGIGWVIGGDEEKKPPFPNPLERTRRPWGGLINDLKRRYPQYKSDFLDGLNAQCMAAAIFMYFAALSGAVAFGGLMGDKTENSMGISETLVCTCVSGVFFALFSGQPLVIVGSTGALLLFDESLYQFCSANGIEFLTTRVWIGLWLVVIGLIVACLEGSVLVKLFTRFTEDIFSALIVLLYIIESVMKIFFLYGKHPLLANYCEETTTSKYLVVHQAADGNGTNDRNATEMSLQETTSVEKVPMKDFYGPINQPNTALFCTILSLGTFAIAYYLKMFRNSQFLGRNARRALGDFGVPIAIIIMVFFDYMIPQTYTEKLNVPEGLSPSKSEMRGWFIPPIGTLQPLPVWVIFASAVPALLVYILLFMETHIAELIIDKKERKLKKGSGFHLDIVLLCIVNVGCGFFGLPWICAATVRSIAHVSALTVMSRTHAPGEKPHLIEVKEQRISALCVSILVGLSVLMAPILRCVPMAVLFGVFLYMGVASIDGIQFFDRIKLLFMPVKHHPQASYVRRVRTAKMHLFTLIQLMCLVVLWIVKSTKASLAFPFFLILMVPLRAYLTRVFSTRELRALDGDQPDVDDDEPDFYAEAPLPG